MPKKTQAIAVHKTSIDTTPLPKLLVNNETITYQDKVKNLGLFINKTLCWNDYIFRLKCVVYKHSSNVSLTMSHELPI